MARILVEGFETGDFSQWDAFTANLGERPSIVSNVKNSGTYSCNWQVLYQSQYFKAVNLVNGIIYGSLWWRWNYYAGGYGQFSWTSIMSFQGPNATQLTFILDGNNGKLGLFLGNCLGTALAWSDTYSLPHDFWNNINFSLKVHPTIGYGIIYLNGNPNPSINFSGNTRNDSTVEIRKVSIGYDQRTNAFINGYWDDIVLDDSVLPPPSKILKATIGGSGSSTQWTPSAGSNYQCINEMPISDADYVSTQPLGNIDLYSLSNFVPGISCNIKSVSTLIRGWRDGVSTIPRFIAPQLKAGSTVFSGFTKPLYLTAVEQSTIWTLHPFTGLPLTLSDVNNFQYGIQLVKDYGISITLPVQSISFTMYPLNTIFNLSTMTLGGNAIPTIDRTNSYGGSGSLRLGSITNAQTCWASMSVTGPQTISFWWAVDSEGNFDFLSFYIDDVLQTRISGQNNPSTWTQLSYAIASGVHTIKWVYSKDGSASYGRDAGWVSDPVIA